AKKKKRKCAFKREIELVIICASFLFFQKHSLKEMMLLLRFSSKLSWRYQQLLLVLLLAVTICYAIPMKYKYDDPFVMDVNTFLHTKRESGFLSIEASMDDDDDDENSIRNITALVRSKRSCCGSLSRRRRALHDLERWNYMQNTKQNIRSALLELI
uniref:Uncharacterized protein n=1 Tax=Wuchereria bancrofti TaxID=6293 RepID=A0A1I8ELW3_WUCBA